MMKKLTLAAFSIAAATAIHSAPAAAQQQRQIPDGWFKLCQKQKDTDVCNVQFVKTANETGQLLVSIAMIELKGKAQRRIIQITVPPMRILPPGVGLQIDGGKTAKLDYVICPIQPNPNCVAEAPLTDEIVNSFKRGGELTITAVNFQNQPTPVKVTLSGFTEAYDGEPIQQSDYEERQKKLQDEIAKRQEEFQKKLQAEQEKAKSN